MTAPGPSRVPVSILDRANSLAGCTEAEALDAVVDRAQRSERLGLRRFWVAEHHGVPGIAGSTPTVLMAVLAARTQSIRIGSGGVMLPNHQPLVVAEQAATLEALFPGRIDLGLGRSLGFTPAVRQALRTGEDAARDFPGDLAELTGFLRGESPFAARPRDHAATPLFVLANGQGLTTAARAGLAVVVGGPALFPRDGHATHPGLDLYREQFRPSPWYAEPYVIVSANVAAADTREAARRLLLPESWALARSRSQGEFRALADVDDVVARLHGEGVTGRDRQRVSENLERSIHGTPREVRAGVEDLMRFTGADELMVTGGMSDLEGRRRSDELLAELFC
ncbi:MULTISPECIES: MsnO8 family LLM class oxidoreductase [Micrococcaceae]|uniref:MsnO8 family LLM class oxidoreductase n=1 Tax=Micrococcaceae TaxID=1268 RepID=UPI00161BEF85|nr:MULTISPECIES: MsnO8 family LLM class oxidoreductase [Micrococcaceae]MBB5750851.1 luciferase family oxidoreductase group 1 [Micrococcus sp. TA1]HRO30823.1 MsnO8 family LLM class oxidoreductase [Citricoccus sp.]HRO92402.1 MsnO8 family LLM class oxidoreductase [Citricoccus sp.]